MTLAGENVLTRHELLERIRDARERSDALFALVRRDALYDRPIPERHRIIFYIGHLEAFDWNLLHQRVLDSKSFHPEFDRLFAFGIDPVGGGLPSDQPSDWPRLNLVTDYAREVRAMLDEKLGRILDDATPGKELKRLLNVAIEHRLMHVETLAYMLHQLPYEKKIPQPTTAGLNSSRVDHRMVAVPAGQATLGLSRATDEFGWDNEFEAHTVNVPAFEIGQFMVTNRQFLDFIKAGGYEIRGLWSYADWEWKTADNVSHPVFWTQSGNEWRYRSMFGEEALALDWPVYVSHAEASAYARWAEKSLPTEAEWHRAAYGTSDGEERRYPWGSAPPTSDLANADLHSWDAVPVNTLPSGQSAFGVQGMLGNGWEWTSTEFAPFPGFEPFPFYPGYSANFFDGKHFVMKGGSPRTSACMLRASFRNWFQPHYQYVYAGFRCVSR